VTNRYLTYPPIHSDDKGTGTTLKATTDGLEMHAACVGEPKLQVNSDQGFAWHIKEHDVKCGKPSFYQIGPVVPDLNYATFNGCPHNEAYAMIQRQTKSKGYANPEKLADFVNFCRKTIWDEYTPDELDTDQFQ